MRDSKGRFLPLSGEEKDEGARDARHVFSKADCRKGYAILLENIRLGRIPSRVASSIRKRIRGFYVGRAGRRKSA
jgi:hypothetical protein